MIIVKHIYQGVINRLDNMTLDEVQNMYRVLYPLTFNELSFEEISEIKEKEHENN